MKNLILALGVFISAWSQAAIVCEGNNSENKVILTLENQTAPESATLEVIHPDGTQELKTNFKKVADVWDGHMTGLITAPGLAVKYEDQYGCIRNVAITASLRGGSIGAISTVLVSVCKGGSTPDRACLGHINPQ